MRPGGTWVLIFCSVLCLADLSVGATQPRPHNAGCPPEQFQCDDGNCIGSEWICDATEDCPHGEDEQNCPEGCSSGEFQCDDGECINLGWICDEHDDCLHGEDEQYCPEGCPDGKFKCDDGTCIGSEWVCDHGKDCPNGEDEQNCPEGCSFGEFQCDDGECINLGWICDEHDDCLHGEDEQYCPEVPTTPRTSTIKEIITYTKISITTPSSTTEQGCPSGEFKCDDGECINLGWICDEDDDCLHGEDEQYCPEGSANSTSATASTSNLHPTPILHTVYSWVSFFSSSVTKKKDE